MSATGILSILPRIPLDKYQSFQQIYQTVGQNTGNLLFTNAVWRQIAGPKERINFQFDPNVLNERLDALVIPAANWFSSKVDFSELADLVEQLTIPVVLVGLGAQDSHYSGQLVVPEGTVRLVRAVSERSASISVRGHYTAEVLRGYGIKNVTVTGCPSLYTDYRSHLPVMKKVRVRPERGLIHSTRYGRVYRPFVQNGSIHLDLFRFAYAHGLDILLQSEWAEMCMLTGESHPDRLNTTDHVFLTEVYRAHDWPSLERYLQRQAMFYFDVDAWSRSLDKYDYVLGTRLHGTIMALNSGVPAMLITHDSRTQEMAEFAAIPSVQAGEMSLVPEVIEKRFRSVNWAAYYERRSLNKVVFRELLEQNGIPLTDF